MDNATENADSVRCNIESSVGLRFDSAPYKCPLMYIILLRSVYVNDPTFVRLLFHALNLIRIETETRRENSC